MNNNLLYSHLKSKLRVCGLSGKKDEIFIRCIFCGDSTKDPNSAHFYIMNRAPYKYYCQKCHSSGIITSNFLSRLKIADYNLISHINEANISYKKKLSYKYGSEINYFNNDKIINFYPNQYTELENKKIRYLSDRLKIDFVESDLEKYKIVLNPIDFFKNNNIDITKRIKNNKQKNLFKKVQEHSIGFLTADKNTIICRSLDPKITGFRYHNFSLFPDMVESKKLYALKKKLDLSESEHKIIMTEGIIDLIGVNNHIYNKDDKPLYVSGNGTSFLLVLDHLASLSLLNVDIEIYSDKDVTLDFYKYIIKNNRLARFNGLNIFYNKIVKDYGVEKSKIELTKGITLP